jgi:hypothetical protein
MKEFNGYWYIYIHSKLRERSSNNLLDLNEAKSFLFEWRVPKNLRSVIIKELEQLELIEFIDRSTIKLKPCKNSIEDLTKVYINVGIIS